MKNCHTQILGPLFARLFNFCTLEARLRSGGRIFPKEVAFPLNIAKSIPEIPQRQKSYEKGIKKEWAKGISRIQISRSLICVCCFQLRESPSYLKTRIKLSIIHLILPLQKAFQLLPQMLIFSQLLPSQIFIEILPP